MKGAALSALYAFLPKEFAFTLQSVDEGRERLLKTIPFISEPIQPLDAPFGGELDGRLYTDLASLQEGNLIVSTDRFYIRTRASRLLPSTDNWMLRVQGAKASYGVTAKQLDPEIRPLGVHLMECAGNTRATTFGLIGVAKWEGIPLSTLMVKFMPGTKHLMVTGFDTYAAPSATSVAGASWVFDRDQVDATGAFLATHMNGARLNADHGGPYRLIVPGWYGCSAIKWVQEMTTVKDDIPGTSQMREYASRTHQRGVPELARDYAPPVVEAAALPTTVEQWRTREGVEYRIQGIVWGGVKPLQSLEIQFEPKQEFSRVDYIQAASSDNVWRLWRHRWKPPGPGIYQICLRNPDRSIPSRRLDQGYYFRSVEIAQS